MRLKAGKRVENPVGQVKPGHAKLRDIIMRMMKVAEVLSGRRHYKYQQEPLYRLYEAVLLREPEIITCLFSRQSGKTTLVADFSVVSTLLLPFLAQSLQGDPFFDKFLNMEDEQGNYRGFANGFWMGIYAPKEHQAEITFDRVKGTFSADSTLSLMAEMGVTCSTWNGNTINLSNGSSILCSSASPRAKIEGDTHHMVIVEEAQDMDDLVVRKSIHPFVASTRGLITKIGTAGTRVCDFYHQIKLNQHKRRVGGSQNHFQYPHWVCEKYNSLYRDYIKQEKIRLGPDSDAFRMAYKCEWIIERGMLVSDDLMSHTRIAHTMGPWSRTYVRTPSSVPVTAAIDFAKKQDATVVTVGTQDNKAVYQQSFQTEEGMFEVRANKKHVLGWLELQGDDWETQFETIKSYLSNFRGLERIVVDDAGLGDVLYDRFRAYYEVRGVEVLPFLSNSKNNSDGFKLLMTELQQKRVSYPYCEDAQQEREVLRFRLQMLAAEKTYKGSILVVEGPEDIGDDYVDSLMMLVWGFQQDAVGVGVQVMNENPFFAR